MTTWTWLRYELFALAVVSALLGACGTGEVSTGSDSGGGTNPPPATTTGSVTLTWDAPTTNTDQSCLTNLTGYRIYHGTTSGSYAYQKNINLTQATCTDTGTVTSCGPVRSCSAKVTGLAAGTWFFKVSASNADGDVGSTSNEATSLVVAN